MQQTKKQKWPAIISSLRGQRGMSFFTAIEMNAERGLYRTLPSYSLVCLIIQQIRVVRVRAENPGVPVDEVLQETLSSG